MSANGYLSASGWIYPVEKEYNTPQETSSCTVNTTIIRNQPPKASQIQSSSSQTSLRSCEARTREATEGGQKIPLSLVVSATGRNLEQAAE